MTSVSFGYMNTRLESLSREALELSGEASFIEVQIHDHLKEKPIQRLPELPRTIDGYITIHCEGETDGKRRIKFASADPSQRTSYVNESLKLYNQAIRAIEPHTVARLILHPDSVTKGVSRGQQIKLLVQSVEELRDNIQNVDVCIEPRGGNVQGKVLCLNLNDLGTFANAIKSSERIGWCIDLAQLFVVGGNEGIVTFLAELPKIDIPVKEIHASDVLGTKFGLNRVAMEIGKGALDWATVLPLVERTCNVILVETLGGVPVFRRSKSFIEGILYGKVLLPHSS